MKNEGSAFLTSTLIVYKENSASASALLFMLSANIEHTVQVGQDSAACVSDLLAREAMKFLSARVRLRTPGKTIFAK